MVNVAIDSLGELTGQSSMTKQTAIPFGICNAALVPHRSDVSLSGADHEIFLMGVFRQ